MFYFIVDVNSTFFILKKLSIATARGLQTRHFLFCSLHCFDSIIVIVH